MKPGRYTAEMVAGIVEGKLLGNGYPAAVLSKLLIDSRKLTGSEDTLFVALPGERNNGHDYIPALYRRGVRNFIVSELPTNPSDYADANLIHVADTLLALQMLGVYHRSCFNIPVIGITGSNGKTIIKEWLYQLMRQDKNIVRSPKSYNSQVGVPLSVWQMDESHDLAIFEAGISQPDEMERLENIIAPTIGIISNIGHAHDENFNDRRHKTKEKMKLFVRSRALIYCRDHAEVKEEAARLTGPALFSWSKKTKADLLITRIEKADKQCQVQAIYKNSFVNISIPFVDDASVENAIHCWATLLYLGYDPVLIAQRMALLSPVAMRLEMKEGINNTSVINDSYNSDIESLAIALDFLNQQKQHEKKTLVLSDILQSGKDESLLYSQVAELIEKKGVTRLIGIGESISRQAGAFGAERMFFKSTNEFLNSFTGSLFANETILLKGARAFQFEKIEMLLQQKSHQTVLEINLNAIAHNLNYFRSKLKPKTKVMAMVKAFSYGSGSFEIANLLQFHHADYLAVAYADEGVELRSAGISMPIMVMSPEEQSFDTIIINNLEPEIFNFRSLKALEDTILRYPAKVSAEHPVPVHIKLDTGMHRLGFEQKDLNELVVRLQNNRKIVVKSVFSHLAASDEAPHDDFTRFQLGKFEEMSQVVRSHFNYPVLRHILNSAGIVRFPDAQMEMVRLGIGLYGIGVNSAEQRQLQNVSTLKTTISQIKRVPANETVGYSRKGLVPADKTIATIPIGYADGLNRKLGNGKSSMLVNGRPAPVIGNVCMDMCMLDITGITAKEGDEVTVFGDKQPIQDIAKALDTIPYEVLTNISRRVKRVYYQE